MTEEKLISYLATAEYLDTEHTDLMGREIAGVISSHEFIRKTQKILQKMDDREQLNKCLTEYTHILIELVKYEVACEVQRTLDNLSNF